MTPVFSAMAPSFVDVSPNDRWLLYTMPRQGRPEVFVRGLSADAAAIRVSTNAGGHSGVWSADGRDLFFVLPDNRTMMTVPFRDGGGRPEIGEPRTLFTLPTSFGLYGIGRDGRFLAGRPTGPERPPGVRVILNWFGELGATPAAK